jgi:hypothetical protein
MIRFTGLLPPVKRQERSAASPGAVATGAKNPCNVLNYLTSLLQIIRNCNRRPQHRQLVGIVL